MPDAAEAYVGRDRYIVVAIAVFNSIVTAHVIQAVGGSPPRGPLGGIMLRLFDDTDTEYLVSGGGGGGAT